MVYNNMEEPKGFEYWYLDKKDEEWKISDDAPDWAKKEFERFFKLINDPTRKF